MRLLVDGYNLLFAVFEEIDPIHKTRQGLIDELYEQIASLPLDIMIVFDSKKKFTHAIPSMQFRGNLTTVFSPHGLSADDYILEMISIKKAANMTTVVTSDNFLQTQAKILGAKTLQIEGFLNLLQKKTRSHQNKQLESSKNNPIETEQEFKRLRELFEKKLKP